MHVWLQLCDFAVIVEDDIRVERFQGEGYIKLVLFSAEDIALKSFLVKLYRVQSDRLIHIDELDEHDDGQY